AVPGFLFVPSGHPLSRRWLGILWLAMAGVVVGSLFLAIAPGPMQTFGVLNPFGIESPLTTRGFGSVGGRTTSFAAVSGIFTFGFAGLFAASSTVIRFRRSVGDQRQRVKWFGFSAVVARCRV